MKVALRRFSFFEMRRRKSLPFSRPTCPGVLAFLDRIGTDSRCTSICRSRLQVGVFDCWIFKPKLTIELAKGPETSLRRKKGAGIRSWSRGRVLAACSDRPCMDGAIIQVLKSLMLVGNNVESAQSRLCLSDCVPLAGASLATPRPIVVSQR